MKNDIQLLKDDMKLVKDDMKLLKDDIHDIKGIIKNIKDLPPFKNLPPFKVFSVNFPPFSSTTQRFRLLINYVKIYSIIQNSLKTLSNDPTLFYNNNIHTLKNSYFTIIDGLKAFLESFPSSK